MSSNGNLVPSHPGNLSAARHGLHARPEFLAPEIAERVTELAELPWATNADRVALEEVGRLLVLIEHVDEDLAKRGTSRTKTLIDHRVRLSRALHRWLEALGATPQTRAAWAARMVEPSFAERVEIELRKIEEERDARH